MTAVTSRLIPRVPLALALALALAAPVMAGPTPSTAVPHAINDELHDFGRVPPVRLAVTAAPVVTDRRDSSALVGEELGGIIQKAGGGS